MPGFFSPSFGAAKSNYTLLITLYSFKMHSFIKAEWKTILSVFVFCGILYGWFYHKEVQKAEMAAAPYEFTCIRAGVGLLGYQLGTPLAELAPQLGDFKPTPDEALHAVRYERNDGVIALNFAADRLASVEYWPKGDASIPRCDIDSAVFTKQNAPTAGPIVANEQRWIRYDGLVAVEDNPNPTAAENEDVTEAESQKPQKIGWIVVGK